MGGHGRPLELWLPWTPDHDQGSAGSGLEKPEEPLSGTRLAALNGRWGWGWGWRVSLEGGPSIDRNRGPWLIQSDQDGQETTVSDFCSRQGLKDQWVIRTWIAGLPRISAMKAPLSFSIVIGPVIQGSLLLRFPTGLLRTQQQQIPLTQPSDWSIQGSGQYDWW